MAYITNVSAPATAVAVTNKRSVPIVISCNGTSPVVLTKSDLAIRTPPSANGTITGILELAPQVSGTNPLYLATVEVAPDYMVSLGAHLEALQPVCTSVPFLAPCNSVTPKHLKTYSCTLDVLYAH